MPNDDGSNPEQAQTPGLGSYLDVMSKAIFQRGISWDVVENKWPEIREVFHDFDIEKVANMRPDQIDAILRDRRVNGNRAEMEAIVENANLMIKLEKENGGFRNYLRSHDDFDAALASIKMDFKLMGDRATYYFLYVVGEEVPPFEQFMARGI